MSAPTLNFGDERRNRGLSQRRIAKAIDIAPSVWGRLEEGKSISPSNALKVATYFGLTVTELWPLPDNVDNEATAAA